MAARAGAICSTVQWGAWHGVGMVAANTTVLARMQRGGIGTVSPLAGLAALSYALKHSAAMPQVWALLHDVVSFLAVALCIAVQGRLRPLLHVCIQVCTMLVAAKECHHVPS